MPNENKTINVQVADLLEELSWGVFRLTPKREGRFIFFNPALCKILEYNQEELYRIRVADVFAQKETYRSLYKKVSHLEGSLQEEVLLKTKKRKIIWCTVSLLAARDRKGRLEFIDGVVENILEQKRTEKELKDSKELFKLVFNNSAAAITVTDKNEKIIAWNPYAEKMLGMDKRDLFNKPVKELYPSKEWRRIRSFRIRRKGMLSEIETRILKKDGSLLDVNVSISVLKDSQGNVVGSIGIINDMTRQKAAERKIKESENKIRIILDNSAAAITLTDKQERIILWNRYTEHLLGMNKEDLYLKPVSSLYPPEEWKRIRAANIRQAGSKHHFETKIVRKNGNVINIDLSVNVLKDAHHKIIGSVGMIYDISQQKSLQQMLLKAKIAAEEASNSKSLFLANMSHEVRTPMNTIVGMVDLTLDTELTHEQQENLKTIKDAADNLLSLINDILDLSRVEVGKIHLEKIELSLHNIVKSVCMGLMVLARNKNLDFQWCIDDQVPEILIGDPVRIRQVLVNLINNAIKFTFKGKVVVTVKVNTINNENCELLFSVADEGVGIPKEKLNKIFDVFSQVDPSTTRRFGGTGLGLSISCKLVELMGGRIWVESEEFKGSVFYFTARFGIVTKQKVSVPILEATQSQDLEGQPTKVLKQLVILLAEDNIVNQKIASKMLEKRGWIVKTVDNGKKVLDYLDKESFDLILMDAQMPELDGFDTTKLIRENEKKTGRHIPIIALTARAMLEDQKKCFECGMDAYVAKPFDRPKLYEAIENLFYKKEISHSL